jgi:chromate transporter
MLMPTDSLPPPRSNSWLVLAIFLRLGLTCFGGPVAHLGYFRDEFVARRGWLSERAYAELIALCQFLPGPTSSQVAMAIGLGRSGYAGALAAWVGFTLPSAVLLILFALGISIWDGLAHSGVLQGLKVAAVAVVAQAIWGMGRLFCRDGRRVALMLASAGALLLWPGSATQLLVLLAAALLGWRCLAVDRVAEDDSPPSRINRRAAAVWLGLFVVLLAALPLAVRLWPTTWLHMIDAFYRVGSLVFGGGHVVLPLLQSEVVASGWLDDDRFLAGYGAAQAVPGPLFSFAAYLGALVVDPQSPWLGGLIGLLAIFAPSFLLVFGTLPFWTRLRGRPGAHAALAGVNAAMVGLLLAALCTPILTSAISGWGDIVLAGAALVALAYGRCPPWLVVIACGGAGWLIARD